MGVLILAAVLFLFNLGKEGYSNSYYASAVKSMLTNPGIIIYNSFDPAGFVTIDKPPVALWVQTLSAVMFGFSGYAIILPQAIAGLCSVFLLYLLITRSWGKNAGLIAAAMLTTTPIFVAVVRTNNMDGLLVFVLLAALVVSMKAWRTGSLWYLTGAAILIGIGFNIKMIQAFAVIPACFGIYLLTNHLSWKKKILHIAVASVVLIAVSGSWAVMMDLTPADQRPYIGSSSENSVFDLISGYNGLNRILGGFGPFGKNDGERNTSFPAMVPGASGSFMPPGMNSSFPGSPPPFMDNRTPDSPQFGMKDGEHPGGMPGMNDGGEPGLFRMGDSGMSGQISWFLPFALIGLLAWIARPSRNMLSEIDERSVLTLAFILWLVPELLYFSFTNGFYHTYYVVMVAIPLAGLVGIGAVTMYDALKGRGIKGWILIAAILITGIIQWQFLRYDTEFSGVLSWIVLFGTAGASLTLAVTRIRSTPISPRVIHGVIILGVGLLCIGPFIWSCTPVIYKENAVMPIAGPGLITGVDNGPGMNQQMDEGNSPGLFSYLSSHQTGEQYLVGVESSRSASNLIITYGASVMAMGGFSGSDPILTVQKIKDLIGGGKIRYFLLGQGRPGMPGGENSSVTNWIQDSCPVIPKSEWSNETRPSGQESTLYDCKGIV